MYQSAVPYEKQYQLQLTKHNPRPKVQQTDPKAKRGHGGDGLMWTGRPLHSLGIAVGKKEARSPLPFRGDGRMEKNDWSEDLGEWEVE